LTGQTYGLNVFSIVLNLNDGEKMKKLFALILIVASTSVFADPQCTTEDKSKWQDQKKFQEDLVKQGYKIKKFKVTKTNCYEIYGWDKAEKKVEIYYNPVDGSKVKEEIH
jgi:hypothetical protein